MDESIKLIENAASDGAEDTAGELLSDRQDGFKPGDLNKAFFLSCKHGQLGACKILAKAMLAIGHPDHVGEDKWEIFRGIFEWDEFEVPGFNHIKRRLVPPLHVATWFGHTDIIQFLVKECKIDINQEDIVTEPRCNERGETALFRACDLTQESKNIETVRFLLEAGANPNKGFWMGHDHDFYEIGDGNNGMQFYGCAYWAVCDNYPELLELLLQFGADPDLNLFCPENTHPLAGRQYSPIDHAINNARVEVLQLLLEYNKNKEKGVRYLMFESFALLEALPTNPRIIRLLQEHVPEYVAQQLWSASGYKCYLQEAKELLDNGADVNQQEGIMNESAILRALKGWPAEDGPWSEEMCNLLIEHGADPFQGGHFFSCFNHVMEKEDSRTLVQWIVQEWRKKCTSMGGSLEEDNYLIHCACFNPKTSYKAMEYLLLEEEFAGLLDKFDANGMLPIHIACDRNLNLDVVYTLLQKKPEMLESMPKDWQSFHEIFTAQNPRYSAYLKANMDGVGPPIGPTVDASATGGPSTSQECQQDRNATHSADDCLVAGDSSSATVGGATFDRVGGAISIVDHEKHTAHKVKDEPCSRPSKRQKVSG